MSLPKINCSQHLQWANNQINKWSDANFSLLIIGERGTGKSFLLSQVGEIVNAKNVKEKLETLDAKPRALIIDLIESLSFNEQREIFELLSTDAQNELVNINGKPECPQLIFTSQQQLGELADNENYYKPFIDRIAQQVIILPSIRNLDKQSLFSAWQNANELLAFKESIYYGNIQQYYQLIQNFIMKELSLPGNFRDLQKLAIHIWRNVKDTNVGRTEKEMLELLNSYKLTHEVEIRGDFFKKNQTADEMIKEFRKAMVEWAEKRYENLSRAELIGKLDISEKTYYNWKNGL